MQRHSPQMTRILVCVIAGLLSVGPVYADKPAWAGGGKEGKHEKKEKGDKQDEREGDGREDRREGGVRVGGYFNDNQRVIVREYYTEQFKGGRCPPGLAKKKNGCLPPGQAKKWVIGRPIPRDVVYYEVPQSVVVRLGPPPSGQRYVRVASDILLLAVGTGMVLDALQDLQR